MSLYYVIPQYFDMNGSETRLVEGFNYGELVLTTPISAKALTTVNDKGLLPSVEAVARSYEVEDMAKSMVGSLSKVYPKETPLPTHTGQRPSHINVV